VERHVARAPLGSLLLQDVRASHVEDYLASLKAAPATVGVHHAVLRGALKRAKRDQLVAVNHAADVELPERDRQAGQKHAKAQCWSADEARAVLKAASAAGTQASAFFALALDTGARKGELLGLQWSHVDLDAGTVTIKQTITSRRGEPTFGPTKTGTERTVDVDPDTVARLRAHRAAQAEVKMKNRTAYVDRGLVFAREPLDLIASKLRLGDAMTTALDGPIFRRVVTAAGVRRIKVHGMRHTVATLLLNAGVPVHEVAARLGHSKPTMTLNTYAHALPRQRVAGARSVMGAVLHGGVGR
jgi:integrase